MPLTLGVAGPPPDSAPDGPPPPPPEVFAALLTTSSPAVETRASGPGDRTAPDPADDSATSAAAMPPVDVAAPWLLALALPHPALLGQATAPTGTTPVPGVGAAAATSTGPDGPDAAQTGRAAPPPGTTAPAVAFGSVAALAAGPAPLETPSLPEPASELHAPARADSAPHPLPEQPAPPAHLSHHQAAAPVDPATLGLAPMTNAAAVGPGVDRTEALAAVQPALVAAAESLRSEGGRTSLVIRLDPPELGALLVRMTVRDGQVELTVRAPDAAAHGGLLAQTADLQQVLRDAGMDLSSYDVSYADLTGQDRGDRQGPPDRGTPRPARTADGLDNVTDDVPDPQPAGTWL